MSEFGDLLLATFTMGWLMAVVGLLLFGSWKAFGVGVMMVGVAWLLMAAIDRFNDSREDDASDDTGTR